MEHAMIGALATDDEGPIITLDSVELFDSAHTPTTPWPTSMVQFLLAPLQGPPESWNIVICDKYISTLNHRAIEGDGLATYHSKIPAIEIYKREYSLLFKPPQPISFQTVSAEALHPLYNLSLDSSTWTNTEVELIISLLRGVSSVDARSNTALAEKYTDFCRVWIPYANARPHIMRALDPEVVVADLTTGPGGLLAAVAAYTTPMAAPLAPPAVLNMSNHAWTFPLPQDVHGFVRFIKGHIAGAGAAQISGFWHFPALAAPPVYF